METKRIEISDDELNERIKLSHKRMSEPFYDIDNVYASDWNGWPGDKEGRALLAFVCLVNAGEPEIPCMEKLIKKLPEWLNEKGYIGEIKEEFYEQQLSGHSWLLRGLCEYYEKYQKPEILGYINGIVESLYMPLSGKISDYPLLRKSDANGGVDGHTAESSDGWLLSTDTCCAFMSIDGLSHVFEITKDEKIGALLEEMSDAFMKIDKREIKAQTHCTLTAARGMLRLYGITGNGKYLEYAKEIFSLYVHYGITYTYENYNWWGRPDTWTEPCAVVDSLMLAGELYKITGISDYRTLAARIYHNGFATLQRCNGGAGTQKIVCEARDILEISGFEAKQCCTMRLAEGLRYIKENRGILYAETTGEIVRDENGIYRDGDIIYAETVGDATHTLHPLIKYYRLTEEQIMTAQQRVVFKMKAELITDVRYGEHERNVVDIAFPENASGNVDLVLMIHGGGWIGGDKDCYRNEIQKFAESGVVSASMNYRYICENSSGLDILDDITAALETVKKVGAEKGVDIRKCLLTGLSAGGHLSLLYGYSRVDEAPIKPAAVVTLSGPTDMVSEEAVDRFIHGNEMGDEAFVLSLVSNLCGMKLSLEDRTSEAALTAAKNVSPLYFVNKNTVPTVICHAEHDKIVPFCNAVSLEKALTENGVEHEFVIYPTSGHCLESDPDCTKKTNELTAAYIKKYLSVSGDE